MQENTSNPTNNSHSENKSSRRIFFALPIDEAVRCQLADYSATLRKAAQFTSAEVKWVPKENYHITLHFLGSTPEDQVQKLIADLPEISQQISPFSLDFRGIGYFPHPRAPKVLWAGIDPTPSALLGLVDRLRESVSALGIELKHDNFHAHVTLGRFKRLKGTAAFVKQAEAQRKSAFGRSDVDRVHLMESDLRKAGPIYQIIGEGMLTA